MRTSLPLVLAFSAGLALSALLPEAWARTCSISYDESGYRFSWSQPTSETEALDEQFDWPRIIAAPFPHEGDGEPDPEQILIVDNLDGAPFLTLEPR